MVQDLILARMKTVLVSELIGSLWQHRFNRNIDPKWYELVFLSLLSANLDYFNYHIIKEKKNSKDNEPGPTFDYKQVLGHENSDIQTKRLLKPDFEEFLGNITEFDVVGCPDDNCFPVINGARHFMYKDGENGENVTYVTALLHVTLANKHVGTEDSLDNMIAKIKEGAKKLNITNHRIEFWWLARYKTKTSLWTYVNKAGLCERIVWPKLNV